MRLVLAHITTEEEIGRSWGLDKVLDYNEALDALADADPVKT